MPLEWKDAYSVGNPAVDHEHQELIELVNALTETLASGAPRDRVVAAFGDLLRAISSHFALEERFMREHRYDQAADHKADHERLLDDLREIMEDYEGSENLGDEATLARLVESVDAWFVNHFRNHDARLHARLGDHPH